MTEDGATPSSAGFAMPAEWEPHAACLMAWPARRELWGSRLADAESDYAAVARAVSAFEHVIMVCPPGSTGRVRDACGSAIEPLELPIDDSWLRDSGPIFVRNAQGEVAAVSFTFNAWGERWHPHGDDALVATRLASHFGMRLFSSPMVLEGGAFLVDGEGTLITTEQCLLNPTRNPTMTRDAIEDELRAYLGVTTVIWLPVGHSLYTGPAGTDGHVDGVAQFVGPGHVLLEIYEDPTSSEFAGGKANLAALRAARDAHGRELQLTLLDPGDDAEVSYVNHYLANGAVIVPLSGTEADEPALARLSSVYPDREVVGMPGMTLAYGGGGPHCITQQIPAGPSAAA